MAKKPVRKRNTKTAKKVVVSPFHIYWKKTNYLLLVSGFVVLAIGFFLMSIDPWNSFSCLVLSPIVVMLAYLVIVPAAIWYRAKSPNASHHADHKETENTVKSES